jgi:hypothetical protein
LPGDVMRNIARDDTDALPTAIFVTANLDITG